jgi:hypothetical protein
MFVVGSICFFKGFPLVYAYAGDWLFIGGSTLVLALAAHSASEAWVAWGHQRRSDEIEVMEKLDRLQAEFVENMHFVISAIIFTIGCYFFMPGIYENEVDESQGHEIGAWCFIIGSFGFVLASYWNACGIMAEHGKRHLLGSAEARCVRLSAIALSFAMVGGVCFVAGSFLYRPGLKHWESCRSSGQEANLLSKISGKASRQLLAAISAPMPASHNNRNLRLAVGPSKSLAIDSWNSMMQQPDDHRVQAPICTSAMETGTWLFVCGSCCFLVQSLIGMSCTIIMHTREREKMLDDLVKRDEEEGIDN